MKKIHVCVIGSRNTGKTSICQYPYSSLSMDDLDIEGYEILFHDDPMDVLPYDVLLATYDTSDVVTLSHIECTVRSMHKMKPIIVVGVKDDIVSGILGGHTQRLPHNVDVVYVSTITGRNMNILVQKIIERSRKSSSCNII